MRLTAPKRIVILWYRDDRWGTLLEGFVTFLTKLRTVLLGLAAMYTPFPRETGQTFG